VDCLSRHGFANIVQESFAMFTSIDTLKTAQESEFQSLPTSISERIVCIDGVRYFRKFSNSDMTTEAITKADLIWVPKSLVNSLLQAVHGDPLSGHFGVNRVIARLRTRYFWQYMYRDVKLFVKSCHQCQMRQIPNTKPAGYLQNIETSQIFEILALDFVGPISKTRDRNEYLLVAVDHFSKFAVVKPIPKATAEHTANFILHEIILKFGPPTKILSDRGSQFLSNLVMELLTALKIKKINTTAYHPQTDGLTESVNKTLVQLLAKTCFENVCDWDLFVPYVTYQYNTSVQESTGFTPYEVLYGASPRFTMFDLKPVHRTNNLFLDRLQRGFQYVRTLAAQSLEKARVKQKIEYDRHHTDVVLSVGDRVLVADVKIRSAGKKLNPKYLGPYTVINQTGPVNYQVRLDPSDRLEIFHVGRLKLYHEPVVSPPAVEPSSESESYSDNDHYAVRRIYREPRTPPRNRDNVQEVESPILLNSPSPPHEQGSPVPVVVSPRRLRPRPFRRPLYGP